MEPDVRDVTFAVYHAGGGPQLVDVFEIAVQLRARPEDIDAPLADAVEQELLIQEPHPATGRLTFRLAPAGQEMIEGSE